MIYQKCPYVYNSPIRLKQPTHLNTPLALRHLVTHQFSPPKVAHFVPKKIRNYTTKCTLLPHKMVHFTTPP